MANNAAEPLATYIERLPQVKRVFRLYKDRVEIDAAWTMGKNYHSVVRLADLRPETRRTTRRNRWFKKAIVIASISVATAVVFQRGDYSPTVKYIVSFGWPVTGLALVVAFLSFAKRRFVHFVRKDGAAAMDLCNAGPDAAKFEEFTAEIQRRIRNA
jgi:hypothetical protein